jgi:hypothetical protein
LGLSLALIGSGAVRAQQAPALTADEQNLLEALASDPMAGVHTYATRLDRSGRLTLVGRVATKAVHDRAIQVAIANGIPVVDGLVIDSSAPILARQRVAAAVPSTTTTRTVVARPAFPSVNAVSYPYAMPLFGPPVDPLYGYEPPLITYPPWWQPLSEYRTRQVVSDALAETELTPLPNADLPPGSVEMTLDGAGYARLRGKVPSEEWRSGLVRKVQAMPEVAGVIDRLEVDPNAPAPQLSAPPPVAPARPTIVPAPPEPGLGPGAQTPEAGPAPPGPPVPFVPTGRSAAAPAPAPAVSGEPSSLTGRVHAAIAADPDAQIERLAVSTQPGGVRLEGRAGDVRHAIAAVQRAMDVVGSSGLRVEDRIEVAGPAAGRPNPLADLPADVVEPYLASHLARNLGASVAIERLEANGPRLRIVASAPDEAAVRRAEASLRSMPLLRGLVLDPLIHER